MAAPVREGYATMVETGNVTSIQPSDWTDLGTIEAGDLLVAFLHAWAGSHTAPAGWTQIDSLQTDEGGFKLSAWWKEADGTEDSSDFIFGCASGRATLYVERVSGADPVEPTYVWVAVDDGTGDSTQSAPDITTPGANCLLTRFGACGRDRSFISITNATLIVELYNGGGAMNLAIAGTDDALGAGAEGASVFTWSGSADFWAALSIAYEPVYVPEISFPGRINPRWFLEGQVLRQKKYTLTIRGTDSGAETADANVEIYVNEIPIQPPEVEYPEGTNLGAVGSSFGPLTPEDIGLFPATLYVQTSGTTLATFGLTLDPQTGVIAGDAGDVVDTGGAESIGITPSNGAGSGPEALVSIDIRTLPGITLQQQMSHIRMSFTANSGWENYDVIDADAIDAFGVDIIQNHADVVDANTLYTDEILAENGALPIGLYSNFGNQYNGPIQDWMSWCDDQGGTAAERRARKELAFFHVTEEWAGSGSGASTQAVTIFYKAYLNGTTDKTADSYDGDGITLGGSMGNTLDLGMLDRFDRAVVDLNSAAAAGWTGVWKYWDGDSWATLTLASDGTSGMTVDGTVQWEVPADWEPTTIDGQYNFFVRLETTVAGTAPVIETVLGDDFTGGGLGTSYTIPVFDEAADLDGDDYLDDAEYATRESGKDARFRHQARLFGTYGPSRWITRVDNETFRDWAGDYHSRYLDNNPVASYIAMDNCGENMGAFTTVEVEEIDLLVAGTREQDNADGLSEIRTIMVASLDIYADDVTYDSGDRVQHNNVGWRAVDDDILDVEPGTDTTKWVSSHWIMCNVAGAANDGANAEPIFAAGHFGFDEFRARGCEHTWSQFEGTAGVTASRLAAGNGLVGLDSIYTPFGGQSERAGIACLAHYYQYADPTSTFLTLYAGAQPASNWSPEPLYTAWSGATNYVGGEYVEDNGNYYRASDASTNKRPGTAATWSAVTSYSVGDLVTSSAGHVYIAIDASLDEEPPAGTSNAFWNRLWSVLDEGHWQEVCTFDVGNPTDSYEMVEEAADPDPLAPEDPDATYRIYRREFENAIVVYKPISYSGGSDSRTALEKIGDDTETTYTLGGTFYPVAADGTIGAGVTSVNIRNGEGFILSRSSGTLPSTGLILSIEADDTHYQDAGRTTPATSDDDPIGSATDGSGNGNHLESASGNRPVLKTGIANGEPVIRFTGASEHYLNHVSNLALGSPCTILMCLTIGSTDSYVFGGSGGGQPPALLSTYDSGANKFKWFNITPGGDSPVWATSGSGLKVLAMVQVDGTSLKGYYDSTATEVFDEVPDADLDGKVFSILGCAEPTVAHYSGDICALRIHLAELTPSEIGEILAFWANKYGAP